MGLWSRLKRTFRDAGHRAEIEEELRFHLEMDLAEGATSRQARIRLGNLTRIGEDTRSAGILEWLESAIQDAFYGLRQLRKAPVLALAVLLSLAVGLGANTAIFSLIDAALLKPLPVRDPDALVILEWTNLGFPPGVSNINGEFRTVAGDRRQGSSVGANVYRQLAHEQSVFESLIGIGAYPEPVAIAVNGSPAEQAALQYVSTNFFEGLGTLPVIGRSFLEGEDRAGAEPVLVASHRFWVSRFGRRSDLLARHVRINNVPARIVGVAPPEFFGLRAGQWPDLYAPLAAKVAFSRAGAAVRAEDDGNWWVRQVGRLKPGVSAEGARARLEGLFRTVSVPDGTAVEPNRIPELIVLPGRRGFDALNARETDALWTLLLLVAVLLLIVCVNVANLLLSRSVGRQRESAVRLALGASRSRLLRQHLIESTVLAILGGGGGLALGYVLAHFIHLQFQTGRDPSNAFDLHLDVRILAYTAALCGVTALLFGLAPALRAARANLGDALKTQTRSVLGGPLRLPRMLVSIQIALCLAALMAAGLLSRTLVNLKSTDIGFDRHNLVYASVSPARAGYPSERIGPYVDRVRSELARLPGVLHVSAVQTRFLSGGGNFGSLNFPGRPFREDIGAHLNAVGDGFLETFGVPLLAGRMIDQSDMRPGSEAVVIDDLFARRFFPNESPLGRRFGLGPNENSRFEIVGVVGNTRYNSLRDEAVPAYYQWYRPGGTVHFAIRTSMDSAHVAEAVRRAVASVDPAVPVTELHTQTALIDRLLRTERLLALLSGAFGFIALTLAAIGLAGLLAYTVARRTNEIGVRMALGATASDVIRMVLKDSLALLAAGILMGLPCVYLVGRALQTSLFRLQPLEPFTAVVASVALLTVALFSAWIPARRAAGIDPLLALREE